ncbi:hypothetical protein SAMN05216246_10148 [Actinomyces denticolens]|uniref:Uncharacterized protein n=1 Tax=Actinomyces denticolens TaxID=52767 RepID=A0ABY1HYK6_9ACTO|nr:hypothetical protein SAMN05216246_10148 [Actinomyces denticolens]
MVIETGRKRHPNRSKLRSRPVPGTAGGRAWVAILIILLMIGLFFIYTNSRQKGPGPDRPVSTHAPHDEAPNYWTEERMKSAPQHPYRLHSRGSVRPSTSSAPSPTMTSSTRAGIAEQSSMARFEDSFFWHAVMTCVCPGQRPARGARAALAPSRSPSNPQTSPLRTRPQNPPHRDRSKTPSKPVEVAIETGSGNGGGAAPGRPARLRRPSPWEAGRAPLPTAAEPNRPAHRRPPGHNPEP